MCYGMGCLFEVSSGENVGDCSRWSKEYQIACAVGRRYNFTPCEIGTGHAEVLEDNDKLINAVEDYMVRSRYL